MSARAHGDDVGATQLRHPHRTDPGVQGFGETPRAGDLQSARPTRGRFAPANAGQARVRRRAGVVSLAFAANLMVVVFPAAAVYALTPSRGVASLLGSVALGVIVSVTAASLGAALWRRRVTSGEVVFSDLMLWGWLRRVRFQRRFAARQALVADWDCKEPRRWPAGHHVAALKRLSELIDAQDPYTRGHSVRVTRHAERVARAMHLPACDVAKLRTAAALHDIGKLNTPQPILHKPGRLTDEEFDAIKRHPGEGADMLSGLDDPAITAMVRHHHERLDGSGYPDGLIGDEIPLGARIIAVADTFDAMTSNRAYRGAFEHKKALDVLSREAGTRLDAAAVSAFHAYYSGRRLAAGSTLLATLTPRLSALLERAPQLVSAATPSLGKALPAIGAAALVVSPSGQIGASDERSRADKRSTPGPGAMTAVASGTAASGVGAGHRSSWRALPEPASWSGRGTPVRKRRPDRQGVIGSNGADRQRPEDRGAAKREGASETTRADRQGSTETVGTAVSGARDFSSSAGIRVTDLPADGKALKLSERDRITPPPRPASVPDAAVAVGGRPPVEIPPTPGPVAVDRIAAPAAGAAGSTVALPAASVEASDDSDHVFRTSDP